MSPTHKTPRELRLAQDLANATALFSDEIEALIEVLQRHVWVPDRACGSAKRYRCSRCGHRRGQSSERNQHA